MFGINKKAKENKKQSKKIRKQLQSLGINETNFKMFLAHKQVSMYDVTDDLIQEYQNRKNIIEKIAISCTLYLPEMYNDVNNLPGAVLQATTGAKYDLTNTSREQVQVKTNAVIVKNGIVFKKAINNAEDLRIGWEDITDVKSANANRFTIMGSIQCDNITYNIFNMSNKDHVGELFFEYVDTHKKGMVDDGWD